MSHFALEPDSRFSLSIRPEEKTDLEVSPQTFRIDSQTFMSNLDLLQLHLQSTEEVSLPLPRLLEVSEISLRMSNKKTSFLRLVPLLSFDPDHVCDLLLYKTLPVSNQVNNSRTIRNLTSLPLSRLKDILLSISSSSSSSKPRNSLNPVKPLFPLRCNKRTLNSNSSSSKEEEEDQVELLLLKRTSTIPVSETSSAWSVPTLLSRKFGTRINRVAEISTGVYKSYSKRNLSSQLLPLHPLNLNNLTTVPLVNTLK